MHFLGVVQVLKRRLGLKCQKKIEKNAIGLIYKFYDLINILKQAPGLDPKHSGNKN